ncbi:MAG: N-methylproline demethylase, partial [Actinomycetota bacterium]
DVILYDDDGSHSALTAAELLADSGVRLEVVTPERTMGVDIGGLNLVPYARSLNAADVRVSLNQRVRTIVPDGSGRWRVSIGSEHSPVRHQRVVDAVVGDHGVLANDALYFELVDRSTNLGELDHEALLEGAPQSITVNASGTFQLFRIGDAVEGRNIHAAIYDALRICKDL